MTPNQLRHTGQGSKLILGHVHYNNNNSNIMSYKLQRTVLRLYIYSFNPQKNPGRDIPDFIDEETVHRGLVSWPGSYS